MAELKCYDYAVVSTAATNQWQLGSAVDKIIIGTSNSTRIGNKIFLKAVKFTIVIYPLNTMAANGGTFCRFLWYHNTDCKGSIVAGTDFFVNNDAKSNRNNNKVGVLKILDDRMYPMMITGANAGGATTATSAPICFTKTIYPNKLIQYTGSGSTPNITDVLDHDYGYGFCADGNNCCNVSINVQTLYTDM